MAAINTNESLGWEGIITFGVLDEAEMREKGFLDDQEAFFNALQSGEINFKRTAKAKNTVTNYARQQIVNALTFTIYNIDPPRYIELGTGTGTPSTSDTDLWSPSSGTLKQCSTIQPYMSYFAQYICVWVSTDPIVGTWSEIGLKDYYYNLWAHSALTNNLTIASGEVLVAQWQIQIVSG